MPFPRTPTSVRARLFVVVDDHSRLLVHGRFHPVENTRAGQEVLRAAVVRRGVRVIGKGDKELRIPLDPDVASLVQAYLLAERPETTSDALFVVAKGPHRGQPLSAAGLRRVFRYHARKRAWRPVIPTPCAIPSGPPWPKPASTWP